MKSPSSDTIIVTSHPAAWDELAAITCETHKRYCDRWGFDYDVDRSDLVDSRQGGEKISIRGFVKFNRILHFMPMYKYVLWLDADLVVTNLEYRMFFERAPIMACYDWNGFNSTVQLIRSTPRAQAFYWACNNTGRDLFLYHGWHEMEAMRYFSSKPPYQSMIDCISVKEVCAVLPDEYVEAGVPREIMAPYAWEPGDFAVHLSALSLPRRIDLAQKYAQELHVSAR